MLPPTLQGSLTWDQAPVRHWAGQGTRRHGLLASGRLPRQALAGMALRVPLERGSRHCTPRVCSPSFPQLRLQVPHSSTTHLETDRTKVERGRTIRTLPLGAASHQRRHVLNLNQGLATLEAGLSVTKEGEGNRQYPRPEIRAPCLTDRKPRSYQ